MDVGKKMVFRAARRLLARPPGAPTGGVSLFFLMLLALGHARVRRRFSQEASGLRSFRCCG